MFEDLNPMNKTTAVLEIVIMLVVAFLIGILTAWLARKKKVEVAPRSESGPSIEELENANSKIEELSSNIRALQAENKQIKNSQDENANTMQQIKVLNTTIEKQQAQIEKLHSENLGLEEEVQEHEKLNFELKHILKRPAPKFSSKEEAAETLGFKLAKEEDKEDLTVIKGIGPFIQEKLNELGIYTIEQISDFTIDTVINVTEAIEYFPGRIQRDFWVEQANQILNDRVANRKS